MKDKSLLELAPLVARSIPDHAGKSFSPPLTSWINQQGNLCVLGNDGRKFVFTPESARQIAAEIQAEDKATKIEAPATRTSTIGAGVQALPTKQPAKTKAGK